MADFRYGMRSGFWDNRPVENPQDYSKTLDYDKLNRMMLESAPLLDLPRYDKSPMTNGSTGAFENSMHEDLKASNDDSVTNQRYADLQLKRDELKQQIMDLKADIAYQEKLRSLEMSKDPMWDAAKYKFIYDNDSSALENIMNRQQTMKIAKMNKEKEQADKSAADERSANFARNILYDALTDYNSKKGNANQRIMAGRDLLKAYQDFREKAELAGKAETEFFKEDNKFLSDVKAAIEEARSTTAKNIDTSNKAAAQNKKNWDTKANDALKRINGWANDKRQKMYDDNVGGVQDYIEQVNGIFRKKKNPYGG